jgi:MFS family permease
LNTIATLDPQTRRNMGIMFTSGLLFWASLASLLPTLSPYIKHLGANNSDVGIIMGAFAIGLLLCRPQMGKMADQRGRKVVLLIGIGVAAIAPYSYLLIHIPYALIPVRIFHGLSIAAFTTAYSALVADLSPPDKRGELIGYMSLVNPIGMATGPAMGAFLLTRTGFTQVFLLSSVLGLVSWCFATQVKTPPLPSRSQALPTDQLTAWQLLGSDRMRIPTLTLVFVGIAVGTVLTFVPLFVRDLRISPDTVGLFYTAAAVMSFVVRLLAGRASDRYGRGRFITVGLTGYLASMLLLWQAHDAKAVVIAGLVEGIGGGMFLPIMVALMTDRCHPQERGRVFGLFIAGFDLGIALAGPCLGFVADRIGYHDLFGVAALVTIASLIIFVTLASKDLAHSLKFALGPGKDVYALPKSAS